MTITGTVTTTKKRLPIIEMISPERDRELARINAHHNFLRDFGREAISDEGAFDHNCKLAAEVIAKCGGREYPPILLSVCKRTEAYTDGEEHEARLIQRFANSLLGGTETQRSFPRKPFKHIYLTTEKPEVSAAILNN